MKKLFNIFILLLSVVVITSCGGDENDDPPILSDPNKCLLSVTISGHGRVYIDGKDYISVVEIEKGKIVTLSAIANYGCEFVNWTTNGEVVSLDETFQIEVTSDITYNVNFSGDVVDTPTEILNSLEMIPVSSIYVSNALVTKEVWNAVMSYKNGMKPVNNLIWGSSSSEVASNITYSDIENVFLSRLNMITGKSFRLPTSTEMAFISPYVSFTQKVQYVWCSNYDDEVKLYSSEPDSPEIPVIPTTRLVYAKNGAVMSISMTFKSPTIGFVLVSDSY